MRLTFQPFCLLRYLPVVLVLLLALPFSHPAHPHRIPQPLEVVVTDPSDAAVADATVDCCKASLSAEHPVQGVSRATAAFSSTVPPAAIG